MTHKELLKLLTAQDIDFVVVGGVALRLYNSPRVTHDIDLAVRPLDIDTILFIMYEYSYYLLTEVEEDTVSLALTVEEAGQWIEVVKAGSVSFIQPLRPPKHRRVAMEELDLSSQVDILFELGIPITQLKEHARIIELQDISFRVASVEDLIRLKEQRSDRSQTDDEDIRFLKGLLEKEK